MIEQQEKAWEHFKGEVWKREINVREFIQFNYTPYVGDDSFLVGPTEKKQRFRKA